VHRRRLVPTVLLAAGVAVALAATPLSTAAPSRRSAPPACATGGLVVWMNTNGNGTAGTVYYVLRFTNLSGHACTLRGFPGVSAVKLNGQQLGSAAARDQATPVKTISIPNGHTAKATLGIVEAGNFPTSKCGPTTAAGLRVYPPNQTASKIVPFPFAACSHNGPVFLRIRTVT
jgi:Domain of unknown function (DUF4232)